MSYIISHTLPLHKIDYRICVVSPLLYGRRIWVTPNRRQDSILSIWGVSILEDKSSKTKCPTSRSCPTLTRFVNTLTKQAVMAASKKKWQYWTWVLSFGSKWSHEVEYPWSSTKDEKKKEAADELARERNAGTSLILHFAYFFILVGRS